MERKTVVIPSISCRHCVMTIKNELLGIEGVQSVEGAPETKMITVTWTSPATWETIERVLRDIDYAPSEA